jgi:hypothetical protein
MYHLTKEITKNLWHAFMHQTPIDLKELVRQRAMKLKIDFFFANWFTFLFFSNCSKRDRSEGRGNLNIYFGYGLTIFLKFQFHVF